MDPAWGNHLQQGWLSLRMHLSQSWIHWEVGPPLDPLGSGSIPGSIGKWVPAEGQDEEVLSHEAKLSQGIESKINEDRSQKWRCGELGAVLGGTCPALSSFRMLPGKETATGKAGRWSQQEKSLEMA